MNNDNLKNLSPEYLKSFDELSLSFESKSSEEILRWALNTYAKKIGLASSFGAEDVVLIDMISKLDKNNIRIFTLDTGRLNQETYHLMDEIKERYSIPIDVYFPYFSEVENMVAEKGFNLMYKSIENRKLCCEIRKVKPLNRALEKFDAWITGLRREQTFTRFNIKKIEIDSTHNNIIKVNPLSDWTNEMVWDYIHKNDVPYNKLHDTGYPSIGCEPCTRAIKSDEDPRAGRWWWEESSHKECGIHLNSKNQ
ncbi:MAG: phosphoadenylyl-sulfate reductase [Nitrososphaeraceae archaeon]|nr:phosphoadenylyl-sulfate reductase [Nitrososphaeraceae archaeon]